MRTVRRAAILRQALGQGVNHFVTGGHFVFFLFKSDYNSTGMGPERDKGYPRGSSLLRKFPPRDLPLRMFHQMKETKQ